MKHKQQVDNEYYTGNSSTKLLVHILQNGVEVDKPVKARIFDRDVRWNKRQWFIYPPRFIYDSKGIAHQYVDVNDEAVLTFHKDHTDKCRKCGGKMTIDTQQARSLGRNGIFHAIWGLDSSHMILLIVMAMIACGSGIGLAYFYNQDSVGKVRLESANKEIARLNAVINPVPVNPNMNPDGSIHN